MAITKEKKRDIVATLESALSKATSAVFVRFHKLSVTDTAAMRRALKREGVGYYVAKKTLLRRALDARGYKGQVPDLPGEVALAWNLPAQAGEGDSTAVPRGIYEHVKKHKDALTILGGIFDNAFADAVRMAAIAMIPPLPVLRGMFVNVINAPVQGLVIALDQIAKNKK